MIDEPQNDDRIESQLPSEDDPVHPDESEVAAEADVYEQLTERVGDPEPHHNLPVGPSEMDWPLDVPRPVYTHADLYGPFHCLRCDHEWTRRDTGTVPSGPPRVCARCRSPRWDASPLPGEVTGTWWKKTRERRKAATAASRKSWQKRRLRELAESLGPDVTREVLGSLFFNPTAPPLPPVKPAPTPISAVRPDPATLPPAYQTGMPAPPPRIMTEDERRRELLDSLGDTHQ